MAITIGVTLAFFFESDFASSLIGMSGKVKITAVGKGDKYNSIEDTDTCNMIIYLQDGYSVLIPGMEIEMYANVKVHHSTTKPLLRANFSLELYDQDGIAYDPLQDVSNLLGSIQYQINNNIVASGDWYLHTDNYYYYVADNSISSTPSDTILSEVDATSNDQIVHFINSPIKFPDFVTSEYSAFGVKIIVTFQAIQNYVPDDSGNRLQNTINNSLKIFSSIFDSKYKPTPLEYFDIIDNNGVKTISPKSGVTLPETLVLPTEDADGNKITAIDDSFSGNQNIKKLIIPSSYTSIAPNAFQGSSITSIDMSNCGIETISDSAFEGCSKLTSVKLPDNLKTVGANAFRNASITSLVLPETIESLESCSLYLTKLTSIYIPKNVKTIGDLALNCQRIKKIVVDSENDNYKDVDNVALLTKDNKKLLYFASGNKNYGEFRVPEGVEQLELYSFHMCTIYDLYLPSTLNSIDRNAFGANSLFANIYVDSGNTNFKSMLNNSLLVTYNQKKVYKYCALNSASSVIIPESIEEFNIRSFDDFRGDSITINKNLKSSDGLDFANSSSLKNIYVDEQNTYFKSIDNKFLTSKDGKILYRVAKLNSDSCVILDGVEDIRTYAVCFQSIQSYEFPSSLKYLRYSALFVLTNGISSMVFNGTTPPQISADSFANINMTSAKIYVPDSAVNTYKTNSNWSKYADKILPLSQKV